MLTEASRVVDGKLRIGADRVCVLRDLRVDLDLIVPRVDVLRIVRGGELVAAQRCLVLGQRIAPGLVEASADPQMRGAELVVGLRSLGPDRQRRAELLERAVPPGSSILAAIVLV